MKNIISREIYTGFTHGRSCKKFYFQGAKITQNHPGGQKMRFFKVQDIDTIIEPGEKERQTDVSSALKMFADPPSRF